MSRESFAYEIYYEFKLHYYTVKFFGTMCFTMNVPSGHQPSPFITTTVRQTKGIIKIKIRSGVEAWENIIAVLGHLRELRISRYSFLSQNHSKINLCILLDQTTLFIEKPKLSKSSLPLFPPAFSLVKEFCSSLLFRNIT